MAVAALAADAFRLTAARAVCPFLAHPVPAGRNADVMTDALVVDMACVEAGNLCTCIVRCVPMQLQEVAVWHPIFCFESG